MHVHHAGEKNIYHAEWSLAFPFTSDLLFDLLTVVPASHIAIGSNTMDNIGVSSLKKTSGVDSEEVVVLSSLRWMGSIHEEDADGVGPARRCTTCAYGNINKYQNYETCNGTYAMSEIFTFAVDTLCEPVGVTGL